jgi:hypothetical protein
VILFPHMRPQSPKQEEAEQPTAEVVQPNTQG